MDFATHSWIRMRRKEIDNCEIMTLILATEISTEQ